MGIVRRQSLFISIIVYSGFILGAFNVLYLFPTYFTPEQFGLTRVFFASASTFIQLASLGVPAMMVKFFPYFNDRLHQRNNDFLTLSLLIPLIGFIVVSACLLLFRQSIIDLYQQKSPIFAQYFYLLFFFSFTYMVYRILETYASIIYKNIIPALVREVGIRLYHLTIIAGFIVWHNFEQFIYWYVASYLVALIPLTAYIIYLKRFVLVTKLSIVAKRIRKPALSYGGFLYSGGLLLIIAENIDTLLIAGISGLESTAVFAVASYIATIIQVPQKTMNAIVAPMVAQAWKDKNTDLISRLYKKTAITQLCFSIFVFMLIWVNIRHAFTFLPVVYSQGIEVIFIMGIARIIDQGMGINGELLNTSIYWRVSFIADVVLVGISIPLNYYLIKQFGIVGSAYANFISFTFFNTIRVLFVWKKMHFQPFTKHTLYALAIGLTAFLIGYYLPPFSNVWFSMVINTLVCGSFMAIGFIYFKVSEDINTFVDQLKHRFLP